MSNTPRNEKDTESVLPETPANPINPTSTPTKKNYNSVKKDHSVSPQIMNYFLNAYKHSPQYDNLMKKRFNTGFTFLKKRRCPDIQIFTPEEDNSPKWNENWPQIENRIQGEPGEIDVNIFMSIPGLSESDVDEEPEEIIEPKRKRFCKTGRKKSVGYRGVPVSDE